MGNRQAWCCELSTVYSVLHFSFENMSRYVSITIVEHSTAIVEPSDSIVLHHDGWVWDVGEPPGSEHFTMELSYM